MQIGSVGGKPSSLTRPASMAPVGLEVASEADPLESGLEPPKERVLQTGSIQLPLRRRRLGGIVIATVATCTLILVAAVIARVSQASSERQAAATRLRDVPASVAGNGVAPSAQALSAPPASPAPAAAPARVPAPSDLPTSGTVRVEPPAVPGRVWVDGKKLSSASAVVTCGAHQIKIGPRGRAHSVQVPCGGELVVSR
jgi:hypothetical protein